MRIGPIQARAMALELNYKLRPGDYGDSKEGCILSLMSLYFCGDGIFINSNKISQKTGLSISYLKSLERGFEGWTLFGLDPFRKGYRDGKAIRRAVLADENRP